MRAHSLDVGERAHPPHEMMLDSQLHLAADLERGAQEHVERVAYRALARILDRHHAEVRDPALHFAKHLVDRRQGQRAHRGSEVLEHGGLGERALGAEKSHLERLLLSETRRHDLAKQARDFLVAQRSAIALERLAQHLRLALGTVEIDRLAARGLRDADLLGEAGALVQQLVDARVDGVDLRADAVEIEARRTAFVGHRADARTRRGSRRCGGGRRGAATPFDGFSLHPCLRSNSRMKPTSASTAAMGTALYRLARMPPRMRWPLRLWSPAAPACSRNSVSSEV